MEYKLLKKAPARGGTNEDSIADVMMMSMSEGNNTIPTQEDNQLLSFEEFKKKGGNFHMFFGPVGNMYSDMYRSKTVYQNALAAHPEFGALAAELQGYDFMEFDIDEKTGATIIKPADPRREEMMRKLYDAYLIMKPYAKRSGDLFG